jgi:FtsP/CotA-like multicopper oxidase with cupredoxin domain
VSGPTRIGRIRKAQEGLCHKAKLEQGDYIAPGLSEANRNCGMCSGTPVGNFSWFRREARTPNARTSFSASGIALAGLCFAYSRFARAGATALSPDETFEMTFAKDNAADEGFNRWTINGVSYPMTRGIAPASFRLKQGKHYRIRMRNASDDIHPIHLHRHTFGLTKLAGKATAGVMKDVVMVGGYQEVEVEFTADNPGLTLFHCHQQLHMDFGFMALFDYV